MFATLTLLASLGVNVVRADGWAEGEGKGFVESKTLLSQRLNARGRDF
jgi:hypothetical protein